MGLINFFKDLKELLFINTRVCITDGINDIGDELRKKEFSKDKLKIVMISEYSQFLDNSTPIFAVNKCNKEGMDIQLDLYGKGRGLKNIVECINSQNCLNIHYKGEIKDTKEILKDYDIFFTASYSPDIQFKTIEALRCGLPVILTDVKGNGASEFIKGNGYLIPENNIELLKDILKGLYEDKSQLAVMGQNSRKLYEEKFKVKQQSEKTFDVHKEVLGNNYGCVRK